mmetsp:Transcript_25602/g.81242  ORF Transcript_25602/g.81242 Transcript_25602/m.81242 type:complete len:234 (-) Transcript_25602:497-1198(-)
MTQYTTPAPPPHTSPRLSTASARGASGAATSVTSGPSLTTRTVWAPGCVVPTVSRPSHQTWSVMRYSASGDSRLSTPIPGTLDKAHSPCWPPSLRRHSRRWESPVVATSQQSAGLNDTRRTGWPAGNEKTGAPEATSHPVQTASAAAVAATSRVPSAEKEHATKAPLIPAESVRTLLRVLASSSATWASPPFGASQTATYFPSGETTRHRTCSSVRKLSLNSILVAPRLNDAT